jgi:hypothetical protein
VKGVTENTHTTAADPELAAAIADLVQSIGTSGAIDRERMRAAARSLQAMFSARGLAAGPLFEDLPDQAALAVERLRSAQPEDLGELLRTVAGLVETRGERVSDLEALARWLQTQVAPILGEDAREPQAEAPEMDGIRAGARRLIAEALREQGLGPASAGPPSTPHPPAAAMTRHRVFWRNFEAIAPALAGFIGTAAGAETAGRQVSALLASLDLPAAVAVRADESGAVLSFAPPTGVDEAELLRRMLADAPAVAGWRFAIGEAML